MPLDVTYDHRDHAEEHQDGHKAYSQHDGRQIQLVIGLSAFVGAGGVGRRQVFSLALGAAVLGGADADRLTFGSDGAGAAVQAWPRGTVVHRPVTVPACVAWEAAAGVVVDAVDAGGAVGAGVPGTLVDVDFTAQACEA